MSGKRPVTATFHKYVGFNRKPADVAPRAAHYFVQLVWHVDGERGTPREVHTELSAAQVVMLLRALPTSVLQELTGIDRAQFMRAAGMSEGTIAHVLGTEPPAAPDVAELFKALRGDPWRPETGDTS